MILLVCTDDRGGMLFNHRRQSQDRAVREDLLRETAGAKLLMNAYSAGQFEPDAQIICTENCLACAGEGEYCFVREDLLRETAGAKLLMNAYSAGQFEPDAQIICTENCLACAGEGEYCFVENLDPCAYSHKIEKVIVYRWNRIYPADVSFPLSLKTAPWRLEAVTEFSGSSHEKITKEVYVHENI